jgi:ADP-ribose pyrophosphatase YjhB (NUDIX family)
MAVPDPNLLARGPWTVARVSASWRDDEYVPSADKTAAADAAIAALRDRGSPAHDGIAARLVGHRIVDDRLELELQPMRWALRLVAGDASEAVAATCVTRDSEGRWLAGRRAPWVASWAGRWALGAAGAVDFGENPADTLGRELREEWSVEAERLTVEALVHLPQRLVMVIGTAWLPAGAEVTPDHEHDEYAWWPADVSQWPAEGDEPLQRLAELVR